MRLLLALFFVVCAGSVLGADWSRFANARFGYIIDVPPDYFGEGEAPNGDGQVFHSANGTQLLRVYGGHTIEQSFEASVNAAMNYARDAGWSLSYERVTPSWASYSGLRNGMVLYARAITLCGGGQFASFELEYPERDLQEMHAVVDRLVAALQPTGDGADCS